MTGNHFFDPFEPRNQAQRYQQYAHFRSQTPLAWGRPPRPGLGNGVYVFSHEAVTGALKHQSLLQAPLAAAYATQRRQLLSDGIFGMVSHAVLFSDPPRHGVLRRPLTSALTPPAAQQHAERMRHRAESLAAECARRGQFDMVTDFATPYIAGGLLELLGFSESDIDEIKQRTGQLAGELDITDKPPRPGGQSAAYKALTRIVQRNLDRPRFSSGTLSKHLGDLVGSGRWQRGELIPNLVFLLFAGQETAIDALGNAVLALAHHPGAWRAVENGDVTSAEAVDEFLRYDPSLQGAAFRVTSEAVDLCGTTIPPSTPVVALLGSANRDPAAFGDPDRLHLHRRPIRRSRTFGHGIHICAGQHLARHELAIALETLMAHWPAWRVDESGVVERETISFRGHTRIPVTIKQAESAETPTAEGSDPGPLP